MKASLDTNVIIHLYRASKQDMLFTLFVDGIYIDEFIYSVELAKHGKDVLASLDEDISNGRITLVTEQWLKRNGILLLYKEYFHEERQLYPASDMGEIRAIALARVLGAVSVITDDTKPFGPHHFLMRIPESDIIPFAYYEIIILLYLMDVYSIDEALDVFNAIQQHSPELTFGFLSKLKFFVKRFMVEPYSKREQLWFENFCAHHNISAKAKLYLLNKMLKLQ